MRLFPKNHKFFDLFAESSSKIVSAAQALEELISERKNLHGKAAEIREIEHAGDAVIHETVARLHKTFLTPIDREDIHRLISRMDDVLDLINEAAQAMLLYKVERPPDKMSSMAHVLSMVSKEIDSAVRSLTDMKKPQLILAHCVNINSFEKQGDSILREATAELFDGADDALTVIKLKDIYGSLEAAIDRANDVATIIEGIVLKHA
jgi:predicted phosphate transport protein (TIGR00153 family)